MQGMFCGQIVRLTLCCPGERYLYHSQPEHLSIGEILNVQQLYGTSIIYFCLAAEGSGSTGPSVGKTLFWFQAAVSSKLYISAL